MYVNKKEVNTIVSQKEVVVNNYSINKIHIYFTILNNLYNPKCSISVIFTYFIVYSI